MITEILKKIRPVDEQDLIRLKKISYTAIDVFDKCPMQYKLKYIDRKRENIDTLALNIGTLTHKVLEEKGYFLKNGKSVDYDYLSSILYGGLNTDEENILGVNELKQIYFEEWGEPDKNGLSYDNKIEIFCNEVLPKEMEDENDEWDAFGFEVPFAFVYDERFIIQGFIDRIDIRESPDGDLEYRVVDYKSSKSTYNEKNIVTAKQMFIYALACAFMFGKLPTEFLYRFILINKSQKAMTAGWEKRGLKTLERLLTGIEENTENHLWKPKPSQLCYWCDYCKNNLNSKKHRFECPYYMEWTPQNKTFKLHKEWEGKPVTRKLVF